MSNTDTPADAMIDSIVQDICELDNNPFDGMADDDVWLSLADLRVILERNFENTRTTSLAAQDVECGDAQDVASPDIHEMLSKIGDQIKSLESAPQRLESFIRTLFVNAERNPKGITAELVSFFCHAALHGYTLERAAAKWEAKPTGGALPVAPSLAAQDGLDQKELPEVAAMRFIEILRSDIAASVTILTDNEDANYKSEQVAIEVCAEWTNWRDYRIYGESVLQCLAKAVGEREALSAIRENKS